jgi:hypothetical protein
MQKCFVEKLLTDLYFNWNLKEKDIVEYLNNIVSWSIFQYFVSIVNVNCINNSSISCILRVQNSCRQFQHFCRRFCNQIKKENKTILINELLLVILMLFSPQNAVGLCRLKSSKHLCWKYKSISLRSPTHSTDHWK